MRKILSNIRLLLTLPLFCLCTALTAQVPPPPPSPIEMDTTVLMTDTVKADPYDTREPAPAVWYDAVEAPAYEFTPVNRFKHNSKLKVSTKPDQPARYSEGLGVMLRFIAGNVNLPYSYLMVGSSEIVLVRVIVGKDSLLYNPEILYSPGSVYSVNAQDVIEKLPGGFIPATKNGIPVDSYMIIPVRFETGLRNYYNQY